MQGRRRLRWPLIGCVVATIALVLASSAGCRLQPAELASDEYSPYFSTNQQIIEGFSASAEMLDLNDIDAVFWHVFSQLPDQVTVYPSENYYYFQLFVGGRQMWGNMRIASTYREEGMVPFAYFEFAEFSPLANDFTRSKLFKEKDGVILEKVDEFTYTVRYREKETTFNLHQLKQIPPEQFSLGDDEVFIERTFDESGYQFFLIFNEKDNYFFWVLNEEEVVPDVLDPVYGRTDVVAGRRSGFVFWIDEDHNNRKILASIRQHSVVRNDYFDGPFDQLADNNAKEVNISSYMVKSYPGLKGRIDAYGYYTDTPQPLRVALTTYGTYYTQAQFLMFIDNALASKDVYKYISRRGIIGP